MNQANPSQSIPQRLLRLPEVCSLVGLGKSSIYEGVKAGTFPAPIKLSRRAVVWPAATIDVWITEKIKAGGK
jgi:prophage regulatory protein